MNPYSQTPVMVFDIETVPDIAVGKRIYQLEHLSDADALVILEARRYQEAGSAFLRLPCHKIVCISGLWVDDEQLKLFSLTSQSDTEAQLLEKFFAIFSRRAVPALVTWNGSGFDLPVLTLRALKNRLAVPRLFEQGETDSQFKYNNYQNRYHSRHTDLMDVLSHFNQRNFYRLDEVACLLGLPGKGGHNGLEVKDWAATGDWQQLGHYCEGDVLNTWFIYLHWLHMKGRLSDSELDNSYRRTRHMLEQTSPDHPFLQAWHNFQP